MSTTFHTGFYRQGNTDYRLGICKVHAAAAGFSRRGNSKAAPADQGSGSTGGAFAVGVN